MDKLFYSKENFQLLNQILSKKIHDEHDYHIENKYNKDIVDTMKFVFSKVNPQPPKNMSPQEYLDLMNIKTLSIITPRIKEVVKKERSLKATPQQVMQQKYHQPIETFTTPQPQELSNVHEEFDKV